MGRIGVALGVMCLIALASGSPSRRTIPLAGSGNYQGVSFVLFARRNEVRFGRDWPRQAWRHINPEAPGRPSAETRPREHRPPIRPTRLINRATVHNWSTVSAVGSDREQGVQGELGSKNPTALRYCICCESAGGANPRGSTPRGILGLSDVHLLW